MTPQWSNFFKEMEADLDQSEGVEPIKAVTDDHNRPEEKKRLAPASPHFICGWNGWRGGEGPLWGPG